MNYKRKNMNEITFDVEFKRCKTENVILNKLNNIEKSLKLVLLRQNELYKNQEIFKKEIKKINKNNKNIKQNLSFYNNEINKKETKISKLKGDLDILNSQLSNINYKESFKSNNNYKTFYS